MTKPTLATAALGTPLHLACVRGPDRGAIIPFRKGQILGRSTGLTDPLSAWAQATVVDARSGLRVEDHSTLGGVSAKKPAMRVGSTIQVGGNRFQLRRRPVTPVWTVPETATISGSLRFTGLLRLGMPLFLLLALSRFLPILWVLTVAGSVGLVGGVWGWKHLRAKRESRDAAALLLVAAAKAINGGQNRDKQTRLPPALGSADSLGVFVRPRAKQTLTIEKSTTCATVGPKAHAYALWIAGQLQAQGAAVELAPLLRAPVHLETSGVPAQGEEPRQRQQAGSGGIFRPLRPPKDTKQSEGVRQLDAGTLPYPRISEIGSGGDITVVLWQQPSNRDTGTAPGEVPSEIPTILPSFSTGEGLWLQEMENLLARSNALDLPQQVLLGEITEPGEADVRRRWAETVREGSQSRLHIPIGVGANGTRWIDLSSDGPHSLVVGGTGSGKSEFLGTLVLTLALTASPKDLRFVFIDYKGGAGLAHLSTLPHVEQSITDLDGSLTPWLLRALRALLTSRKIQCRDHGVRSVEEWEAEHRSGACPEHAPPRIVIVADEVNALAEQDSDLMEELVSVCRQGRSLGIHLVAAAQRAGGAISAQMRSVLDLRVALRCAEVTDSIDALGTPAAARLPKVPGRAIVGDEAVQLAYVESPGELVTMLRRIGKPMTPVLARPLPDSVTVPELLTLTDTAGSDTMSKTIGLCEDPLSATTHPLGWSHAPLLLTGPPSAAMHMEQVADAVAWISATPLDPTAPTQAIFRAQVDRLGLGGVAHLLAELPRQLRGDGHATLIVPDFSETLSQIDQAAGGDASRRIVRDLLAASQTGALTLIATDTKPRTEARAFPATLVHVPSARVASLPEIAQFIPHREDSPLGSTAHWVCPAPARFVASGLLTAWGKQNSPSQPGVGAAPSSTESARLPRIALLPMQAPKKNPYSPLLSGEAPPPPALPTANPRVTSGKDFLKMLADIPRARWHKVLRIQLITDLGPDDHEFEDSLRKALAEEGMAFEVEHLSQRDFHRIDASPSCVKVAREPRREIARVLASLDPVAAPWILASLPFSPNNAVLVTQGIATRFEFHFSSMFSSKTPRRDSLHTINVGLPTH